MKLINLIGQRFGRLLVIKRGQDHIHIVKERTKKYVTWECQCDCGNIITIRKGVLTRKRTPARSCGCLKRDLARERERKPLTAMRNVISSYKASAREREIEFTLSDEECHALFQGNCHYCGIEPIIKSYNNSRSEEYIRNGIDRINSDTGYVIENCVTCCSQCNIMKSDYTTEEFINKCNKIVEFYKKDVK